MFVFFVRRFPFESRTSVCFYSVQAKRVFFVDVVVLFDLEGRNTLRSYSRLAFRILGQILAKQMSDGSLDIVKPSL